jgi:hypothetical protein
LYFTLMRQPATGRQLFLGSFNLFSGRLEHYLARLALIGVGFTQAFMGA